MTIDELHEQAKKELEIIDRKELENLKKELAEKDKLIAEKDRLIAGESPLKLKIIATSIELYQKGNMDSEALEIIISSANEISSN